MLLAAILMLINESTIPFTSNQPEPMPYVYLFTIFGAFCLSVFGPMAVADISAGVTSRRP